MNLHTPDWDPLASEVTCNPLAAYDQLRERRPVAYSERMGWSLFRHADVRRALLDPATFSSVVSRHVSVPNGMDPPAHTIYRRLIDPYFADARIDAFTPHCRRIAARWAGRSVATAVADPNRQADPVNEAEPGGRLEVMREVALPYAVRVQCAFLGWPECVCDDLIRWTEANRGAIVAQDRAALAARAREFEELVGELLDKRIRAGARPEDDTTVALAHETIDDRPLGHDALTSIVRNWTVGEIGTLSAAIGILVGYLADRPGLQQQLRARPDLLPVAVDEILRIHGPLLANRRTTNRPVTLADRTIPAGERVTLVWVAANRDGRVFPDPESFRWDRDPAQNLL
ncbi:MAG TPA: cytochrome P450, partial [Limnochordia bacterium]|nr:cytochrome P450 [Limnochordia bacterium]